jgi:RNA polymerase sigma-70 factor (subfamily 1)
MPDEPLGPEKLAEFRSWLVLLARISLDPRLRTKFDSSDVAQQTLAQAVAKWGQFKGQSEVELRGWLRAILAGVLNDRVREFVEAGKRDVRREHSLEKALEDSSVRLDQWLADAGSSPSSRAEKAETLRRQRAPSRGPAVPRVKHSRARSSNPRTTVSSTTSRIAPAQQLGQRRKNAAFRRGPSR